MSSPPTYRCPGTCRCSDQASVLALDTSHACLLARYAHERGGIESTGPQMEELLERHRCAGVRSLMTSTPLKVDEMNLANDRCPVRHHAPHIPPDALDSISEVDGGAGQEFKGAAEPIVIGDRDCTLVAAAEYLAGEGEYVCLVTDDLNLYDACLELAGRGDLAAFPMLSPRLLVNMYECGALEFDDIEAIERLERDHYGTYAFADEGKRARKHRILAGELNRVAQIRVEREAEVEGPQDLDNA